LLLLCCAAFFVLCIRSGSATPLDDYVNAPDPTFKWSLNSTFTGGLGYKGYVLELISQTWMTSKESNTPVWRHWITVCVPDLLDTRRADKAFMYMDGGHTHDSAPTDVDALTEAVCIASRTVSAHLTQIPDEPIIFQNDGISRSEDALIAYTWKHFFNYTNEPVWLARLPMTKAAVKAMDAIQAFIPTLGLPDIKGFVIAGASKRGWTTWTTAAVDKRVVAMVPMVMPILNIVPNMNHHYQAYGGWSFALDDYLEQGLMAYLNKPVFLELAAVVDPYTYKDRLTMPKLVLCAAGDEFFLPDSPQFFIHELPGETYLNVIPDAEHSLATAYVDVGDSISSFYEMILTDHPRPVFTYELKKGNDTASIIVKVPPGIENKPAYVTLWYANTLSDRLRDFRLVVCDKLPQCLNPVIWYYTEIPETTPGSGVYIATMQKPAYGWTGFLVELTYSFGFFNRYLRLTTEVNIVPDYMPFPPCGNHCQ